MEAPLLRWVVLRGPAKPWAKLERDALNLERNAFNLGSHCKIIVVVGRNSTCRLNKTTCPLPVGAQYCASVCYKTEKGKPATTRHSEGVDLEGELVGSVVAKVGGSGGSFDETARSSLDTWHLLALRRGLVFKRR